MNYSILYQLDEDVFVLCARFYKYTFESKENFSLNYSLNPVWNVGILQRKELKYYVRYKDSLLGILFDIKVYAYAASKTVKKSYHII